MNREEMMQEVNRRTSDQLMDHLFAKAKHLHGNREWKDCDCSFCKLKKEATFNVGHIVFPKDCVRPVFNDGKISHIDPETFLPVVSGGELLEPWEKKDILRENLRNYYRNKLKELCNE